MHQPSISALQLTPASQLRPGSLAAPGDYYLPLLPSGPGGVHSSPPRKTQSSTPLDRSSPEKQKPRAGLQPRYSGSRVQGTASSPSSTAQSHTTMASRTFQDWKRSRGHVGRLKYLLQPYVTPACRGADAPWYPSGLESTIGRRSDAVSAAWAGRIPSSSSAWRQYRIPHDSGRFS